MFVIVLELDLQVQLVMFVSLVRLSEFIFFKTHAKHLALIMDTVLDQTNVNFQQGKLTFLR